MRYVLIQAESVEGIGGVYDENTSYEILRKMKNVYLKIKLNI